MKNEDDLARSIGSMLQRVDEPGLEHVVADLVRLADLERIAVAYNNEPWSYASPLIDDTDGYLFRIRIKPHPVNMESRAELVFDILHELGHCFDLEVLALEDKDNNAKKRGREVRAWAWADQEFSRHPALAPYQELYLKYRAICLNSYPEK
ncbi:alkaline phosphatase family protein [Hymenobacter mucosus]|uniref:IrrE N-terminal-like domain-containing protein n=1 Tax=Hymenobacter mucosus TaxID=1411120 RepID=A0A238ZYV6_9BACT|nr:hypothetical protein [Hymenobacter mucosus]SNR88577.1 hypothetical protein SAMN06269173_11084 [Hymenobacter mucosus]